MSTGSVVSIARHALPFDAAAFTARLDELLHRHPAVGLACGVVAHGRLALFRGHGLANIETRAPVTADTVFRIASITKTMTAVAILQLVERRQIELDAPANDYLRAYRLVPARPEHRQPTVRHLLTYTAGMPECVRLSRAFQPVLGETVPFGERVPSLAEFYEGALHLVAEPGAMHIYSNHLFATLGQIVEDVTGEPLDAYLRAHIFAPLGMEHSDLARSDRVKARLATGYALRARGPRPVDDRDLITNGGGGVYSTTRDLARYVAALLAGGADGHGSILRRESVAMMFAPQYQPDPRVPGVGFAFYRHDIGGHRVVVKDGLLPGFGTQIALAPDDGLGVIVLVNGARAVHAWLGGEVSMLVAEVLGVAEHTHSDVPQHPETWGDLCGRYSFRGSYRDVQKWFIAGVQVFVHGGRLMLRALCPFPALVRGVELVPDDADDPQVFQIDLSALGVGRSRLVFGSGARSLHLDPLPLSFDKRGT